MTTTSREAERPDPGYSQEDWDEVSDNPKLTPEELAALRPAREVPEVFALLPKRGPGRPRRPDAKVNLTLRIDPALLEAYRGTGEGWQTRMHKALEEYMDRMVLDVLDRATRVVSIPRTDKKQA